MADRDPEFDALDAEAAGRARLREDLEIFERLDPPIEIDRDENGNDWLQLAFARIGPHMGHGSREAWVAFCRQAEADDRRGHEEWLAQRRS